MVRLSMMVCFFCLGQNTNVLSTCQSHSKATYQPSKCRSCFFLSNHSEINFSSVHMEISLMQWVGVLIVVRVVMNSFSLSFQSKKHANKVRRYLSFQNEKEPAFKKLKSASSDSVSKTCSVLTVNASQPQTT